MGTSIGLATFPCILDTSKFGFIIVKNISEIRFNIHAIIPKYVWTHLFVECHALEGIDITSPEMMTDNHLLSILTSYGNFDFEFEKQGIK